jgi:hypothetical protein
MADLPNYTNLETPRGERDLPREMGAHHSDRFFNFQYGRLLLFASLVVPSGWAVWNMADKGIIQPDKIQAAPTIPYGVFLQALKSGTGLNYTNTTGIQIQNPPYVKVCGFADFIGTEILYSTNKSNPNQVYSTLVRSYHFHEERPPEEQENFIVTTAKDPLERTTTDLSVDVNSTNLGTFSLPVRANHRTEARPPLVFTVKTSYSEYTPPFPPYLEEQRCVVPVEVTFNGRTQRYRGDTNEITLRAIRVSKPQE